MELALVLPLLLLLLFGIIDFGRMLNVQITLTEAAREGARAVALHLPAQSRIEAATPGLTIATPVVEDCTGGAGPAANARVILSHAFQPVTPVGSIMSLFGGTEDGSVTITAQGVMPCAG